MSHEQLSRLCTGLLRLDSEIDAVAVAELLWLLDHSGARPASPAVGAAAGTPPEPAPRSPGGRFAFGRDRQAGVPEDGLRADRRAPAGVPAAVRFDGPAVADRRRGLAMLATPPMPALAEPPAVEQSLRPLRLRAPAPDRTVLDEGLTARRRADYGFWLPALRQADRRRLDLTLIIDAGASMLLWQDVVAELTVCLTRIGAFRDVRRWYLHGRDGVPAVSADPAGVHPRDPRELIDPTGRRVCVLVTDAVGPVWRRQATAGLLRDFAAAGPVAVFQPLPQRLWPRTALAVEVGGLTPQAPAAPNTGLTFDRPGPPGDTYVPVFEMTPSWLAGWAGLLAGRGLARAAVVRLSRWGAEPSAGGEVVDPAGLGRWGAEPSAGGEVVDPAGLGRWGAEPSAGGEVVDPAGLGRRGGEAAAGGEVADPAALVRHFLAAASPAAVRLARRLAVVAPLSLGMMRFVQHSTLAGAQDWLLSEVYLGGLLRRTGNLPPGADPRAAEHDFRPGVRELLVAGLHSADAARVLRGVVGALLDRDRAGPLPAAPLVVAAPARAVPVSVDAVLEIGTWTLARLRSAPPAPEPPAPEPAVPADPDGPARRPRGLPGAAAARMAADDSSRRFGTTCPVCRQLLGRAQPPLEFESGRFLTTPSFRIEVGPRDGDRGLPWRVTMLAGNYPPAESLDPAFHPHEVDFVYLLCGGGHIFPDATPVFRPGPEHARQRIDEWNMVAAIGAPASGKTYLVVRTLMQNLDNLARWGEFDEPGRIRLRRLSPLEELPLATRIGRYDDTRRTGAAMPPTGVDSPATTPAGMLENELPHAVAAIREFVRRTVVDGERRAQQWGGQFRQPLVLRTDSGGRRTWTGVADLPGELFDGRGVNRREAAMLRSFDALLWVIDPVVAPNATDWLVAESVAEQRQVLEGSLRPGTVHASGVDVVRVNREAIQDDIGEQVTLLDGLFAGDEGRPLQMLVAVTKCDLIRAALEKPGLGLRDMGAPGDVERGAATYLSVLAQRLSGGVLRADPGTRQLLGYLWGAQSAEAAVRQRRAVQVAGGLLDHFSDPGEFWKLVHGGADHEVSIPAGGSLAEVPQHVRVPSVDEHLDSALRHGSGGLVLLRDLVMSAVGCGLAYGLGQRNTLFRMHREPWITLRFFLCSPLATVPVAVDDTRLEPRDPRDRFPRVDDRSAALTQLLLAVLERARR